MAASYFNHSSSYPAPPPPPPGTSPYGAYRHAYPPAPAPPTAYGAYYDRAEQSLPARDELRTLFIAGLPADAKPREVYNLFRDFPGYVSSHLRTGKSSQVPLPLLQSFFLLHVRASVLPISIPFSKTILNLIDMFICFRLTRLLYLQINHLH